MDRKAHDILLAIGVAIGLAAGAAHAAPPQSRNGILTRTNEPSQARPSAGTASRLDQPNRLDLRAPDVRALQSASIVSQASEAHASSEYVAFPQPRRNVAADQEPAAEHLQALGSQEPRMTPESRAQEMARRFHREGLPVARLWEGHSALVSLGLNQRGKPGLWLIQKIP